MGFSISNPISGFLKSGRNAHTQQEKDRARQKENIAKAQKYGHEETEAYTTGNLRDYQKKDLDKTQAEQSSQVKGLYEQAGVKTPEQQKQHLAEISIDRNIMEHSMKESSWAKAIKSLGYSEEHTLKLIASYKQEQAETQAAYANLMKTVAIIGVSAMTGGAGGAAVSLALAADDARKGTEERKGTEGERYDLTGVQGESRTGHGTLYDLTGVQGE